MKRRYVLYLLAVCVVMALMETVQAVLRGQSGPLHLSVLEHLSTWLPLALLVPVIVRLATRFPLRDRLLSRNNALHLAGALVFPVVHVALAMAGWYWIMVRREPDFDPVQRMWMITSFMYTMEFLLYWLVVGGTQAWRNAVALRARELHAARLEASLTESRLQALKGQLQPHFLFNTLNSISVLAEQGEGSRVVRMTNRLADLLRLSLDSTEQKASLREELAFVERYLMIERERFGDRLDVEWRVDADCLDAAVPSLVLQPLVENAIKHGFGRSTRGIRVTIGARRDDADRLVLEVDDTGPGIAGGAGAIRENVGLRTTRARLEQMYGARQELRLDSLQPHGARARVVIPFERLDRTRPYIKWSHEHQDADRGRREAGTFGHQAEAGAPS